MAYDGIIFDFNGTLFFDSDKQEQAWHTVSRQLRGKGFTSEELYERARDLLAEETASERPIVCPECGSQDVRSEVGETRLKRFGAYLLAGLGALGNGSAGNIRRYFRCNRCGTPFH